MAESLPIEEREGFGLTENSPLAAAVRELRQRFGLIGCVLIDFTAERVGVCHSGKTDEFNQAMATGMEEIERAAKVLHDMGPRQRNGARYSKWENELPEYQEWMREKVRAVAAALSVLPAEEGGSRASAQADHGASKMEKKQ